MAEEPKPAKEEYYDCIVNPTECKFAIIRDPEQRDNFRISYLHGCKIPVNKRNQGPIMTWRSNDNVDTCVNCGKKYGVCACVEDSITGCTTCMILCTKKEFYNEHLQSEETTNESKNK